MAQSDRWSDLQTRILSAAAMAVLGVCAVWIGGWAFVLLVCAACGAMIWEVAGLHGGRLPVGLAVAGAGALALAMVLPGYAAPMLFLLVSGVAALKATRHAGLLCVVCLWILIGGFAILVMRTGVGMGWIVWLICVVIASDVAGYFAGRMLGGPKFWPAVSPKKTWSGTVAGWLLAGLVGAAFIVPLSWDWTLVPISMVIGFAGQMGDIAQSAWKRRLGVKDSSDLIPGHGGVFDRFDAMLGGSAAALLFKVSGALPGLQI